MAQTSAVQTLIKRLIDCWNSGKLDAIDEIIAPNFVRHGDNFQGKREIKGSAGYKQHVSEFRKIVSDFHTETRDPIEQGNRIAYRFHTTGKHNGKKIEFEGVNIVRIEGNRIVEDWVYYDATGVAEKLGQHRAAA
jgi:predicted ester cyclase